MTSTENSEITDIWHSAVKLCKIGSLYMVNLNLQLGVCNATAKRIMSAEKQQWFWYCHFHPEFSSIRYCLVDGNQLVCTKDNFDRVEFHTPGILTASDGRIIFSCGFEIFIESADRQKWLKLCNVPKGKAVVSICYNGGNLYIVEAVWKPGSTDHAVFCPKNILGVETQDTLDVSRIFRFTHNEGENGVYDPPTVSVMTNMIALTCNDKLVSFNLATKVKHTQIFSSHFELSRAVALTTDHFCTTRSYNLVTFPHHGQTRGNMLELGGMDAVRLCSWKGDKLLLLFEDSNDQRACLALLDSRGQLVL